MKKLIFLLIILINVSVFSINITITNENNTPLKDVFVNINNSVKLTNSKGSVDFNINSTKLNIILSKDGFQSESLTLGNTPNLNLNFIMKPLKTTDLTFEFSSRDGVIKYREVGTTKYTSIPFFKNLKTLPLPMGTYEFLFSMKNNKVKHKIIKLDKAKAFYKIDLQEFKNQFFFIGNSGDIQSIHFYNENIKTLTPIKESQLMIFKEDELIYKGQLKNTFTPIELEDGIYNFLVQNKFNSGVYYRGIKLNQESNKNIVITIPSTTTNVSGVIKNKNQLIGGVNVVFTDVDNKSYETYSNFVGKFHISLPPQKYKVTLNKPGFILNKGQNLIYDFSIPNNDYSISLDTKELDSNIQGIITDNKNVPIPNASITVKNGNEIVKLKSDNFGNFSTSILPGLLFIKVEKQGYKSFGVVNKLERFSTLSGLKIPLTPFLSTISGVVTDNFKPVKLLRLTLRDKEGQIKATAISNDNGYYEFADININGEYFISVGDRNFKYYYSKPFVLGKEDVTNKNIILQQRQSRLYIELLDRLKKPVKDESVVINGETYITDSNGFLLFTVPEKQNSFTIKVLSYNYQNKINFNPNNDNPKQITLIVN